MRRFFTLLMCCSLVSVAFAQATFESKNSGAWNAASTWTIIAGTDSNGDNIPDANDNVTVKSGHTVSLSNFYNYALSTTIQSGAIVNAGGYGLVIYGSFSNQGTISGAIIYYFRGNCTFSSTTPLTNCNFYIQGGAANITVNILSGTSINNAVGVFTFQNPGTCNNSGTVTIGRIVYANNNCIWNNQANSNLTIRQAPTTSPTVGVLNANALSNVVTYNSVATVIKPATYYNLVLTSASTKSLIANLTVLNNLTISSGNVLNANNFNITVGGNWTNSANTTVTNQSSVTLNPAGTVNILRSSNEVFNNLIINGTGSVTLGTSLNISNHLTISSGLLDVSASNYTINVGRNFTNNGSFNSRSGLVNLNGTLLQTISGTSNSQFYALTLNNAAGAIVNSAQAVTDVLTVSNGNFNSNGNVTLRSDGTKTARLGVVGAGGSFTGNMIIQKHVSARVKNWHELSSPVQGTTIYDWDDEMYMSGFSMVDMPPGIPGVDGSAAGFKSVRIYNEPTAAYANVTNSNTVLSPSTGYFVWLSDNMSNWNAKTFDSRGVPNFGTQNKPLSFTGSAGAYAGLNMIGNPFASAIDYSLVNKVNTDGHAYGYDNGVWTDYGINAIITAHQGFWAYALGAGASVSFPESCKSSVTATSFHRPLADYCIKLIYTNSDVQFFNEAKVRIDAKGTEKWDPGLDAIFRSNPEADASTIAFTTGQIKLLSNAINDDQESVCLPLELYSPKPGLYTIQSSVIRIGNYKYVWIENIKTGEKFFLDKPISVKIDEEGENSDFVLKLSKDAESKLIENNLASDLMLFNYDQTLNIKSNQFAHNIRILKIFDVTGKLMIEHSGLRIEQNSLVKIDISNLNSGIYLVAATDENDNTLIRKMIK